MTCKKCGAELSENAKFCAECGEAVEISSFEENAATAEIEPIDKVESNEKSLSDQFVPKVLPSEVHTLSREQTMELLEQIKDIAEEVETYDNEIVKLAQVVNERQTQLKDIRGKAPGLTIALLSPIILAIIALVKTGSLFLTIIIAVISFICAFFLYKKIDDLMHLSENVEKEADRFESKFVTPLVTELEEAVKKREGFLESQKVEWAKSIIGNNMFFSNIISNLYDLIKSRRADNLKEALNKYDDELHKQQMEQMQRAIQTEAMKQTAKMGQIERNTQEAADAAKISAVTSYETYKNTRAINKKLR